VAFVGIAQKRCIALHTVAFTWHGFPLRVCLRLDSTELVAGRGSGSARAAAQARREPQGRRQAVFGKAAGPVPGEMWENQLSLREHFLPVNQKVVRR